MIKDNEIRSFFEFLISNTANTDYTENLKDYVIDAKTNARWRIQYMTWERQRAYDYDDGKEAGLAQGAHDKAIEDARNFYTNGVSVEIIAKSLNMSVEEVTKIVSEK